MKKALNLLIGLAFIVVTGYQLQAQDVLGLPYEKKHTNERKPLPYQFLREADVMWSKIVWRQLELKEKMNLPLYYPKTPLGNSTDLRMSLIDVIIEGVKGGHLTAYKQNGNDEFGSTMTLKEIYEKLGAKIDTAYIEDAEGNITKKANEQAANTSEIKRYLIKELWFFDKQRSVLEVRIIGIAPIREYFRDEDIDQLNPQYSKTFWIYYPEARTWLTKHEVFNPKNDANRMNFDDIFQKRMFSSYIFAESNLYTDRLIQEYLIGLETMLESERIKESIFNFEQDLWEY